MNDSAPPPRKRRARRKEARPGEIIDAALHLFVARGYAATKLDEVAAAAGIGKGTIYLYFPTKEALFRAVVRERLLPNLEAAEAAFAAHVGPAAELVRLLAQTFIALLDSELSGIPKLIVTEAGNFPSIARFYADEVVARGFRLIGGLIERGIARGEFRPVDVAATVPLFAAPFLMMAMWKHALGRHAELGAEPRHVIENHVELLLRGLAPEPVS